MSLVIKTASHASGPDWLDVSRDGNTARADAGEVGGHRGLGLWFSPSQGEESAEQYTVEMRTSYTLVRAAWDRLLSRSNVTLVCPCTNAATCHRRVLAGILVKLGAVDAGEIEAAP